MLLSPREIKEITDNEKTPVEHGNIYDQIIKDICSSLSLKKNYSKFYELYFDIYKKYDYRWIYSKECSWSIPTLEALKLIKSECDDIIELYSGTGYWASLLNKLGCNVQCFDNFTWEEYRANGLFGKFFDIKNIKDYSLSSFNGCNLMISWPPYEDEECTKYLKIIKPSKLIYIGEVGGGCCGSDSFFEEIDKNYDELKALKLPQWYGIHDWLIIYSNIRKTDNV